MADLTPADVADLTAFRQVLHRHPDLSGHEAQTAARVARMMDGTNPDRMIPELGGHGLAAVYAGAAPGPTVLFRCELDALPIHERPGPAYRSETPGVAHLCGHDGHMAILVGLARLLSRARPARGRVVLLFQPAEETGAGAEAVRADPRYAGIRPDFAFALHNRPGLPLGHVGLAEGAVACASRGLEITLTGKETHASDPGSGLSPMSALAALMPGLTALSQGRLEDRAFRLVTVTHARMGEAAFGVAPGEARLLATLRTRIDDGMARLCAEAEALVAKTAGALRTGIAYHDSFAHCENHPEAVQLLRNALDSLGLAHDAAGCPMSASEDFGLFAKDAKSAMFYLGSGETHPALHNPDYDFPDQLIPLGVRVFHSTARALTG